MSETRLPYRGVTPTVADDVYLAPNAYVIGDVTLAAQSSVWFGATLRGDVMPIRIGPRSNIQDNCVVHATQGWAPTVVGEDCVVGHAAVLHGCTLGNHVLVGIGAIILDAAEISDYCLIGAGALITARTKIPPGSVVFGSPGRVVRSITEEERKRIDDGASDYVVKAEHYRGCQTLS